MDDKEIERLTKLLEFVESDADRASNAQVAEMFTAFAGVLKELLDEVREETENGKKAATANVLRLKQEVEKGIAKITEVYKQKQVSLEKQIDEGDEQVRKDVLKQLKEVRELVASISIPDLTEVENRISTLEEWEPDGGVQIVEKINQIPDSGPKIDASHIKNLPEATNTVIREAFQVGGFETPIKDSNGLPIQKDASGAWRLPAGSGGGAVDSVNGQTGVVVLDAADVGAIDGVGVSGQLPYWFDTDTLGSLSTATYPSMTELSYVKGVTSGIQTQLDGKVDENSSITGATKTKITYDAKGLVTAGTDATTADIADSTNKRYVTDAQLVVIGNTSGTNSGNVTVTDSAEIDFSLTGQDITASLKNGSIDEARLDASVNASLDLADSALQTVSVDGVTITGDGTPGDPLVAAGGGSGDVTGPASATDNAIVRFDGTTGKVVQNSAATIADTSGNITAGTYNGNTIGSGATSGTNTGDQTSIVGITGTKAQFDTAVTDGNILYVGDVTQYTDEMAQDAVGAMVDSSLVYVDATPLLTRAALTGAVTASQGSNATSLGSFTKAELDAAVSDGNVLYADAIGVTVQAYDADLTTWAGLTPSANAQSLVTAANYAAMRALLDLEAGTDFYSIAGADAAFQPKDADLTTIAGLTATTDNFIVSVASAWASRTPAQVRTTLGLVIGTNVQAWDADLDSWALITRASGFDTFATTPSSANLKSLVTDETGSGALVFATSPALVTPDLGTPSAINLANATNVPAPTFKGVRVTKSAVQSIGTTLTAVTFDTETFDTDSMHESVTNPSRITFTTAGYYHVSGLFNTDANAVPRLQIRLNGTTIIYALAEGNSGASLQGGVNCSFTYNFAASDYIEMLGYFGTTQNTLSGASGPAFMAYKVG